jgi:hypothetical protein
MAWEARGGGAYYYRTRKVAGRVVREYVGGGMIGQFAAEADAEERAEREAEREAERRRREELAAADRAFLAWSREVDTLTAAALLVAGFHRHHRGRWRRRKETP